MSLSAALQPLAAYRQFITYKLLPMENGKLNKIPTDWRTGAAIDPHDPQYWVDYDTAYACGFGRVGFVLTDNDPFWCLDIDNCLTPTGWSELAQELCRLLPGCAVEVSVSGKGLHVFGSGPIPRHKVQDDGLGIGLYETRRFIALGGHPGVTGDASAAGVGMTELIAKYLPRVADSAPHDWTTEPCATWNGPTDDDELLRRLMLSKSAAGAFAGKATAADLWTNNVQVLKVCYPTTTPGAEYDSSSADAALAQHLAFWTGKNCERIKTLMSRSALNRDKWSREDYLRRTILGACSRQVDVLQDKPTATPTTTVVAELVNANTFLPPSGQIEYFKDCVYIADINRVLVPGGDLYKREQFDVMYGGCTFVMDNENRKTTRSPWEAFTASQAVRFPKAHTSAFRPNLAPGAVWQSNGQLVANSWWPVDVKSVQGNPQPFLDHLKKLLPAESDRAIILAYMAAVVQHKGVKFQWAPLLQGTRGNGKTLLSRVLINAVGHKHCHSPKAQEIAEKFNDWLEQKIFIAVEDIYVPHEKREVLELLKPMITSDWQEIRGMGRDKVTRAVCCNFMLNSNHRDAIKITDDNRGIAIFYTAQQSVADLTRDGMTGEYFPRLYKWFNDGGYAVVTNYLENYRIPDELNPATRCHRAPQTSSTQLAIFECMGPVEQEILAAVQEEQVGFRGGWISSHWLDETIARLGLRRQISRSKRLEIMEELGYIRHPGLSAGQSTKPVAPDGKKSVLYIHKDSPKRLLSGNAVGDAYTRDQLESISTLIGLPGGQVAGA